jgi:hypothetical protein
MVKHRLQQVELFINASRPKKLSLPFIYYSYVITRSYFASFSRYFYSIFLALLPSNLTFFCSPHCSCLIIIVLFTFKLTAPITISSLILPSLLASFFLSFFLLSCRSVIEDSTVQKCVREVHQERKTFDTIGDQYSRFH